jgi:protein TonB
MKKALLLLLYIISAIIVRAQEPPPRSSGNPHTIDIPADPSDTIPINGVYKSAAQEPQFPGGYTAFNRFVAKNLKSPKANIDIQGKVFVKFIVEKDGTLTGIKVVRGLGYGCDEEAVRLMKASPKWNPGLQNGFPVRVYFTLPISFEL